MDSNGVHNRVQLQLTHSLKKRKKENKVSVSQTQVRFTPDTHRVLPIAYSHSKLHVILPAMLTGVTWRRTATQFLLLLHMCTPT